MEAEYNLNNSATYYESIKSYYEIRKNAEFGVVQNIFLKAVIYILLSTIIPIIPIIIVIIDAYAFPFGLYQVIDYRLFVLVSVIVAFLIIYLIYYLHNAYLKSKRKILDNDSYIFCLAYETYLFSVALTTNDEISVRDEIFKNALLFDKALKYDVGNFYSGKDEKMATLLAIIKQLSDDFSWMEATDNQISIASAYAKIGNVISALVKTGMGATTISEITKLLNEAYYSKIWFNNYAGDNQDRYNYLPSLLLFADAVNKVKLKIPVSKPKWGAYDYLFWMSDNTFFHSNLFVRIIAWSIVMFFLIGFITAICLSYFGVEVDSKIIVMIISAPIAAGVLIAINSDGSMK